MSPTSTNLTGAECARLSGRRLGRSNMSHPVRRVQLQTHKIMSVIGLHANLVPSGNKLRSRIMTIGDDSDILFVASLWLASGYEILTVEDVRTALDAFASVSGNVARPHPKPARLRFDYELASRGCQPYDLEERASNLGPPADILITTTSRTSPSGTSSARCTFFLAGPVVMWTKSSSFEPFRN